VWLDQQAALYADTRPIDCFLAHQYRCACGRGSDTDVDRESRQDDIRETVSEATSCIPQAARPTLERPMGVHDASTFGAVTLPCRLVCIRWIYTAFNVGGNSDDMPHISLHKVGSFPHTLQAHHASSDVPYPTLLSPRKTKNQPSQKIHNGHTKGRTHHWRQLRRRL